MELMKTLRNLLNAFISFSIKALEHPDKADDGFDPKYDPKCMTDDNLDYSLITELPQRCKTKLRECFTEVRPKKFHDPARAEELIYEIGRIMFSNYPVSKRLRDFMRIYVTRTTTLVHDVPCYEHAAFEFYEKDTSEEGKKKLAQEIYNLMGSFHQISTITTPAIASFIAPLRRVFF